MVLYMKEISHKNINIRELKKEKRENVLKPILLLLIWRSSPYRALASSL
jgi:hypothetical protein